MANAEVCLQILVVVFLFESSVSLQFSSRWNEDSSSFEFVEGCVDDYVSMINFTNSINETGWSYLEVKTNENHDDEKQAYSAGLMEAFYTSDLISLSWLNTYNGYCQKPLSAYCQRLQKYLTDNGKWMMENVESKSKSDPYWYQVLLFLKQLQGLFDGYLYKLRGIKPVYKPKPIYTPDVTSLILLTVSGDLEDLEEALKFDGKKRAFGTGSCSALVKLLANNEDLFVSQDTWNGYNSMLRILKKYDFGFHKLPGSKEIIAGRVMTFSSYPASIYSGDDFYIMSSQLVSMETTIGNSNTSLWQFITPQNTVLEGIRNTVANRLASTGQQWVDIFSQYNSGTYNNQWMIIDYKRFTPKSSQLQPGLFYVLEQIPGMIRSHDLTDLLNTQRYFPSYNVAYFKEIFNISGGPQKVAKYGNWFSYDKTPRANIFRRDHVKVKDVESMMKLMRYNDFTHDPLSACNCTPPYSAENAISARCDLNPANGTYPIEALGHRSHGGTDMKLTTSSMVQFLQFIAIGGPTYDNVPPFQWSKTDFKDSVPHYGHPDLWVFKPVQYKWHL